MEGGLCVNLADIYDVEQRLRTLKTHTGSNATERLLVKRIKETQIVLDEVEQDIQNFSDRSRPVLSADEAAG